MALHLYLDFDGVTHRLGEAAVDDGFRLLDNPNLFLWLPILETLLEPYPTVRIVVSSDWRRLFDDDALKQLLRPSLASRFVGVVEVIETSRANEIQIDAERRGLASWVALDDHPTVIEASQTDPRYIACDSATGLSNPRVQRQLQCYLAKEASC
ncbi:hypothetical protein AT959_02255 [Dechloromonas denitrificans]|uniref:Hydrolase n=1 Tax=Dechloromonas denitrificans TaxID=281362 RepID=A0A133XNW0_9RHOO|nr:HAD domain-containing protein [Dechloromonas denitrificans]KXB32610.1 hypothetical protein AT959_02255 [Dechloromonas denitrificans]